MKRMWVFCIVAGTGFLTDCAAELLPVVRGVSVYAMENEGSPPILVRDSVDSDGKPVSSKAHLTIQFDVLAAEPPALKIRFFHCDRNWRKDENGFVQDENHNSSFFLSYRTAPNGVDNYSYRYVNRFPDADDAVRFTYSGNWIFVLMDKEETSTLAEGRFFVVDKIVPVKMTVTNEYLTSGESPLNQIHKAIVSVRLPGEIDGSWYTTVDIYQNRRFSHPFRIDANDRDSYTFVEGYNTGYRIFSISNILPGNEYRVWDASSASRYPPKAVVRNVEGADQRRMLWRTGPDHNGAAVLNRFGGINSDYLEVLFRLDLTDADFNSVAQGGRAVYLAGLFNGWEPAKEDRLAREDAGPSLVVKKLLRRGIHDYQYVTGVWNEENNRLDAQDWVVLEGNDWRTSNKYHAFVYYNDPRFGGFDRIAGFGVANSSPVLPGH